MYVCYTDIQFSLIELNYSVLICTLQLFKFLQCSMTCDK